MIYSLANGRLRRLIAFSTLDSQPAQAKRRRSSAQPTLGGPSRRKTSKLTEHVVIEESEPEEDKVVRKVGRSKKSVSFPFSVLLFPISPSQLLIDG